MPFLSAKSYNGMIPARTGWSASTYSCAAAGRSTVGPPIPTSEERRHAEQYRKNVQKGGDKTQRQNETDQQNQGGKRNPPGQQNQGQRERGSGQQTGGSHGKDNDMNRKEGSK